MKEMAIHFVKLAFLGSFLIDVEDVINLLQENQ